MKNRVWCLLVSGLLLVAGCSDTPGDESPSPSVETPSPTATATTTDAQYSSSSKLRYLPAPGAKPPTPVPQRESLMPEDPIITLAEPTAAPYPVAAVTPRTRPGRPQLPPHQPEGKGANLDVNHDGQLSLTEAESALKTLDKNHDGVLGQQEREAARPFIRETNRQLRLKVMDLDKDGKISKEEWKQASAPYDTDQDGKLSREEMKAWRRDWWKKTYAPGAWEKLSGPRDSRGLKSGLIESSPSVSPTP